MTEPARSAERAPGTAALVVLGWGALVVAANGFVSLYTGQEVVPLSDAGPLVGPVAIGVALLALLLLFNRAGRFLYVLASLVVAVIIYLLFAALYLAMQPGGLSNEQNLGKALVLWQFVLVGLVAREVMLWTGIAIGARGKRVRRRNRAARDEYERTMAGQGDDGARAVG